MIKWRIRKKKWLSPVVISFWCSFPCRTKVFLNVKKEIGKKRQGMPESYGKFVFQLVWLSQTDDGFLSEWSFSFVFSLVWAELFMWFPEICVALIQLKPRWGPSILITSHPTLAGVGAWEGDHGGRVPPGTALSWGAGAAVLRLWGHSWKNVNWILIENWDGLRGLFQP